jgi:hypothetical protein
MGLGVKVDRPKKSGIRKPFAFGGNGRALLRPKAGED